MYQFHSWQDALALLLLIFASGLIVAKLTEKPRIPDVVGYLLLGILLGPSVLNLIHVTAENQVNQWIINVGATLILFEGGMGVQFRTLKQTWSTLVLLATVGVLISAAVVGVFAHLLLGLPWLIAFLLAAVIASTDPATLIPVFKRVRVYPRVQQTVEAESALNDATATVLVFTLLEMLISPQGVSVWQPVFLFIEQAGIGLLIGAFLGLAGLLAVSYKGWGQLHDYGSLVMLVVALLSFLLSTYFGGSGFMAAFVAGLISGNSGPLRLPISKHTKINIHHFNSAMTVIFRMLIFVLLGSQVNFGDVARYLAPALLLALILMVIARPLTVAAGVLPARKVKWQRKEYLFMCWTRETGVIPAALASMLGVERVPYADVIQAVTFVAILVTILLQASTTGTVAKRLQLLLPATEEEV